MEDKVIELLKLKKTNNIDSIVKWAEKQSRDDLASMHTLVMKTAKFLEKVYLAQEEVE